VFLPSLPPLAVVNRQAYKEVDPVFYRENTLEFNSENLGSIKPNYRHWLPYDEEQVLPANILHKYKSMIANLAEVEFNFVNLHLKVLPVFMLPNVSTQESSCGKVKATRGTDGKVEAVVEPATISYKWNYVNFVLKHCNTADFSGWIWASNRLLALVRKIECAIESHELYKGDQES
jgi:hypothetical protein